MLVIFEAIVVTLWITTHNAFHLFDFNYIGCAISLELFLMRKMRFLRKVRNALPDGCRNHEQFAKPQKRSEMQNEILFYKGAAFCQYFLPQFSKFHSSEYSFVS